MLYISSESVAHRCIRRGIDLAATVTRRHAIEGYARRELRWGQFSDAALDDYRPTLIRLYRVVSVAADAARLERIVWPDSGQIGVVKKFLPYTTTTD